MLADAGGEVLWASASARARRDGLVPGARLDAALDVATDGVTAALRSGMRSSAPVPAVLHAPGGMLRVSVNRASDGVALLRLPAPPGGRNAAFADLSRRLDRASARDLRRLRALRHAESLHRSIVEAISEGLVVFDPAGRVLTANPAAAELFACPAAGLAGRAADDPSWGYLDARGRPLPRDRQPGLAPSGSRGSVTRVLGVRRPDGEVRWVRATARPLEGDGVPGVAVLLSDITRARAARREREEAQSLARLGSFTYEARGDRLDASPELLGMLRVGRARRVSLEALVARVHPDDRAEIRLALNALLDGGAPVDLTHRLTTPGMPAAIVRLRARADGVSGSGRILGTVQDVTAEATRARMLQEAELRFRVAFENAPIGMAIVQLDGRFGRVNRALTEMLGYTDEELLARTFQDITHPDDLDTDLGQVRALLDGERSAYSLEKRYLTAAGEVLWVILSASLVRDEIGQPIYFIAQIMDISGRKRMEERLHRLADRDPLTGLLNRRRFEEELREEVARRRREGGRTALVTFDLDGFKYVNDTLGHKAGDDLIAHAARTVAGRLRRSDLLARLGGDEFALLLPGATPAAARRVAEELRCAVAESPLHIAGEPVFTSMSAGLAMLDAGTRDPEAALIAADVAMYEAKRQGRNRVVGYDDAGTRRQRLSEGLTWSQRLRRALDDGQLVLHAQPVVDLGTGEAVFHELLVRMVDEGGELIPPAAFLASAARFGHMRDLDRWVVGEAARAAARHPDRVLAVNLSGISMGDPGMAPAVADALADAGCAPAQLIVEVTETEAIAHSAQAVRLVHALRELGCRVALDDFGSGFASLHRLKTLPVDILKLDGEFVRTLATDRVDALVVAAARQLADGLGALLVAEHVEDAACADRLRGLGVRLAQGFHLGRPRPLADALGPVVERAATAARASR